MTRRKKSGAAPRARESAEPGGRVAITLSFRQTRCRGCGATRVVTRACADCGAAPSPGEADPAVQRRQRVAALAIIGLQETVAMPADEADADPPTLEEVCSQLAGWPTRFLCALRGAAKPTVDPGSLCGVVQELRRLRARVDRPVRRPWRATCRGAARTIDILEDAADGYIRAFAASTPLEAQHAAEAAQAALDSAAEPVLQMRRKLDRVKSIEGISPSELLPSLAAAAAADEIATSGRVADLLGLDAAGGRIYTSVTGDGSPPAGIGVGLRLATVAAEVTLDFDRLMEVAVQTYAALAANPDAFRALTATAAWQQGQQEAIDELFELGITSAAMAAAAVTDRMTVDALLQAVHRMIEGPAQHLLATLLAVARRRDYAKLTKGDAAALLIQVGQAGYGSLIEGLRQDLRHAAAHRDFRVDADTVVLTPTRAEVTTLGAGQFIDVVLAAQESMLALLVGTLCALAALGVEVGEGAGGSMPSWAVANAVGVRTVLAMAGWTNVEADVKGSDLRIDGAGDFGDSPGALVAALLPGVASETKRLTLVAHDGEASRTLLADVEPLRSYSAMPEGEEREAQFLLAVRSCTVDGTPLVSDAEVGRWFVTKVQQAVQSPLPEAVPQLRSLMRLADRLQRTDLNDGVCEVIRSLRQG